jgi:hypothetical protein
MSVVFSFQSWSAWTYPHAPFGRLRYSDLNTMIYAQDLKALLGRFLPPNVDAFANLPRTERQPSLANAGCDNILFTTFGQTDKDTTACTAAPEGMPELGHRPPPQGLTGPQISPEPSLGGGVVA